MQSKLFEDIKKEAFELTLALYRVTDFFPKNEVLRRQMREKANEIFSLIAEFGYGGNTEGKALQIFARIEAIKGYIELAKTLRFIRPINLSVLYREYEFLGRFFKGEARLSDTSENTRGNAYNDSVPDRPDADGGAEYHEQSFRHKGYSSGVKFHMADGRIVDTAEEDFSVRPRTSSIDPIGMDEKDNISTETGASKGHIGHKANKGPVSERQRTIISHIQKEGKKAKLGDIHALFSGVSSKTIQRDLQDLVSRKVLGREGEKRWTTYFLNKGLDV